MLVNHLMSYNLAVEVNFMVIAIAGGIGALVILFIQESHSYGFRNEERPMSTREQQESENGFGVQPSIFQQ